MYQKVCIIRCVREMFQITLNGVYGVNRNNWGLFLYMLWFTSLVDQSIHGWVYWSLLISPEQSTTGLWPLSEHRLCHEEDILISRWLCWHIAGWSRVLYRIFLILAMNLHAWFTIVASFDSLDTESGGEIYIPNQHRDITPSVHSCLHRGNWWVYGIP